MAALRFLALLLMGFCAASLAVADEKVVERELLIKDGHFAPDVIEVPAGVKIRLLVRNEGPGPAELESSQLGIESVSNAGVTRKVIIRPLDAGEYPFFDEFHSQTAQGKIVVH